MAAPQSFDDEEPTWEDPPEEAPAEPPAWDEGPWWWNREQQEWVWGDGEDVEGEGEWPEDDYPDEEVGGIKGGKPKKKPKGGGKGKDKEKGKKGPKGPKGPKGGSPKDKKNTHPKAGAAGTSNPIMREFRNILCCLLYTSPSPRDQRGSRMPSSA